MIHYSITDETITYKGKTLHRIIAIEDFTILDEQISKGMLGGWIEHSGNLKSGWVANNAKVYDSAVVEDSLILHNAEVFENAKVDNGCIIQDNVQIYGNAKVVGNHFVKDYVKIYDDASVYGHAYIGNFVTIYENANICTTNGIFKNGASIKGHAKVYGLNNVIEGTTILDDWSTISGSARITDAKIKGFAVVKGYSHVKNATICDYMQLIDANVMSVDDVIYVNMLNSAIEPFTAYKSVDNILIASEYFKGDIEQFVKYVKKNYGKDTKAYKMYSTFLKMIKIQLL